MKGINYVDVGTSGGVWGLDRGYCMMIGGDSGVVNAIDPIFRSLAPGKDNTPGKLTVRSHHDDSGQVLISVTDTGVGVPPEKMEQIFNAFFTSKPQGTGVGLPISRSIIESHGGRLWAVSNPASGTTLQFTFPVEATARTAA